MTRRFLIPALWLCLAAVPALSSAQVTPAAGYTPPDDTQSIKVGAVIYYDFTYTKAPQKTDAAGSLFSPSAFQEGTPRAYINITGNISHVISFRITPDISRETGAGASLAGSLEFRLKYGYAQISLDDWTGSWKQSWVRLGTQQTPIIDFQEGIYRYRFQGTVFAERESYLTSSDAGASFHSNLPNNYGDFQVGVYNGEGYSKTEVNQEKALQLRGTLRPLATGAMAARGWRVTAFYDGDDYLKNGKKQRFIFDSTFEHKHVNLGVTYLTANDQSTAGGTTTKGKGYSVWATPFFNEKGNGLEALLRYESLEPNTSAATSTQKKNRFIGGLAFWFPHPGGAATAALLLDYEQVTFPNFAAVAANAKQQRIAVHGLISF